MEFHGSFSVKSKLPNRIKKLKEVAYNLWWCWNHRAELLFSKIDDKLWKEFDRNPVKLLSKVDQERLNKLASDNQFLVEYDQVISEFNDYLTTDDTWFKDVSPQWSEDEVIAYFSTEFGFHESIPIYSGGLGVLAGDHCKSASDLGLPLIGVGLLYHEGYFKQRITDKGWQESLYPTLDETYLPITAVQDQEGNDLKVSVKLANREVLIKIWRLNVGRIKVFLLDTNIAENSSQDRELTSRLYGGGEETRISQEIILGIGGTKGLAALGYDPVVWHMNEGHSVYLGLERIEELMTEESLSFTEALEVVAASSVFTTHTPVPAGNEVFPFELKEKYFSEYWKRIGLTKEEFMNLGCVYDMEKDDGFCLTVLALRLARFNNGVSKLHGEVSSQMWEDIWEGIPTDENPIDAITNGIHTLTWLAPAWEELLDQYLPSDWRKRIEDKKMWQQVRNIPNKEFWQVHNQLKSKLIDYVREKDLARRKRYNTLAKLDNNLLDKDKLTIGFARRFATYKRATLIFADLDRLNKICNKTGKEVQFIFAGKAHPADVPGQELIKKIHEISQSEEFKGKVIILEDYDMNLARYLIQGVDIWLNNPRRPLEASGTSGQKVAANAGLNFSVLDGWWCEGYNKKNGWAIGYEIEYDDQEKQDQIDSNSLYQVLEEEIVPLYYDNISQGIANDWIASMKEAMISNISVYSTDRMVQEYTKKLYLPAVKRKNEVEANEYALAKELVNWKEDLKENWEELKIKVRNKEKKEVYKVEDNINFSIEVDLASLELDDIDVELYIVAEKLEQPQIFVMDLEEKVSDNIYKYSLTLELSQLVGSGDYKYTFRVIPQDELLTTKHELGLIKWI
ncbi:alpha-glucan phosphorylase [Halobacteroides halobius DSM 5150]|uniref:Alpha-glucan phosphorylase n=1 Tax=Halobacteroides halobius (strain ATCC 35273 / DSM 5150 / MD-1) TaxID=748449 RepID=L0K9P5_HALHC|nr:alpha-glucan family phosphorylase [Halobacteroides halobius]AGB41094.1 alpha-glucan phosphorylase [Halobacteroides halobius DSM 5150]